MKASAAVAIAASTHDISALIDLRSIRPPVRPGRVAEDYDEFAGTGFGPLSRCQLSR
jgi:hypothetical protein